MAFALHCFEPIAVEFQFVCPRTSFRYFGDGKTLHRFDETDIQFRESPDKENPWPEPGGEKVSVLSTCVTKQTRDMVYSEARWLSFLSFSQRLTMLYALERESNLGSTFAVLIELSEGRDVGSGPVSRVWNFASNCLPLDKSLQRDGARGTRGSQPPPAHLFARDA